MEENSVTKLFGVLSQLKLKQDQLKISNHVVKKLYHYQINILFISILNQSIQLEPGLTFLDLPLQMKIGDIKVIELQLFLFIKIHKDSTLLSLQLIIIMLILIQNSVLDLVILIEFKLKLTLIQLQFMLIIKKLFHNMLVMFIHMML